MHPSVSFGRTNARGTSLSSYASQGFPKIADSIESKQDFIEAPFICCIRTSDASSKILLRANFIVRAFRLRNILQCEHELDRRVPMTIHFTAETATYLSIALFFYFLKKFTNRNLFALFRPFFYM